MKKEFIYISANSNVIQLKIKNITLPILWNNRGMYGLIPFAKIQNEVELWEDVNRGKMNVCVTSHFYWHDVILVSPQIANALLGEDKSDECTYKGNSTPKSS